MDSFERRNELIRRMKWRRRERMANLAFEFGVSVRTIQRDIDLLSLTYPLTVMRGRYGGGVFYADCLSSPRLSEKQSELLEKIASTLTGADAEVMQEILNSFVQ